MKWPLVVLLAAANLLCKANAAVFEASFGAKIYSYNRNCEQVVFHGMFDFTECGDGPVERVLPLLRKTPVEAKMDFRTLSSNAFNIEADFILSHKAFEVLTATRKTTWTKRYKVAPIKCDGEDAIGTFKPDSVQDWIASLSDLQYNQCLSLVLNFKFVTQDNYIPPSVVDVNKEFRSFDGVLFSQESLVLQDGHLLLKPRIQDVNSDGAKARAEEAARTFIGILRDYGYVYIRTVTRDPRPAKAELAAYMSKYLESQKSTIMSVLAELKRDFGKLPLVDQLSIQSAIRKSYNHINELERQFGVYAVRNDLILDEIWSR